MLKTSTVSAATRGGSSNTAPPLISLVVVTYRSAALLPDFFGSLPDALIGSPAHELVVVDNASGDETIETVSRLAPEALRVVRDSNGGYAAGVNAGLAVARGTRAVMILNPDVRMKTGSIAALLQGLDEPKVGICVPRLVGEDGKLQHSLRRAPTALRAWGDALLGGTLAGRLPPLGETVINHSAYFERTRADWASGAAMLVSRECLRTVGLWNESFFLYSEETEYCLRVREAGFFVELIPEAEAVHIGGEMSESPRLWAMQVWNRIRLHRARNGTLPSCAFHAGVILNEALRVACGRKIHRAGLAAALFASARPPEVAHALARAATTPPTSDAGDPVRANN
jgi:GT2 family glycosyltransferase